MPALGSALDLFGRMSLCQKRTQIFRQLLWSSPHGHKNGSEMKTRKRVMLEVGFHAATAALGIAGLFYHLGRMLEERHRNQWLVATEWGAWQASRAEVKVVEAEALIENADRPTPHG